MRTITLTTDWGNDGLYAAAVKGSILRLYQNVNIIDITHNIPLHDILTCGFVLRNAYRYFPEQTIHIIGVNTAYETDKPYLLVEKNKQYFIGTDTGIFSLIVDNRADSIIKINTEILKADSFNPFPELYVFTKVSTALLKGASPDLLGEKVEEYKILYYPTPSFSPNSITGSIIYIDNYKNIITNISKKKFEEIGQQRPFEIIYSSNDKSINYIHNYYPKFNNKPIALFNHLGLLEICMPGGNRIADLLSLKKNDTIFIKFTTKNS